MAKIIYEQKGIDPAKISGPYSLLAVMLLVAEILFAIWFYKAQSSVERSIAGSLMAAVFITLMLLIMRMNQNPDKDKNQDGSVDTGISVNVKKKLLIVRILQHQVLKHLPLSSN